MSCVKIIITDGYRDFKSYDSRSMKEAHYLKEKGVDIETIILQNKLIGNEVIEMEPNRHVLFLKIIAGDWINQSRDEREISIVSKLGATVIVLAKQRAKQRYVANHCGGVSDFECEYTPFRLPCSKSHKSFFSTFYLGSVSTKIEAQCY